MKLSIVIPTKNEERYLPLLLQSIRDQSFADYEIIVADAQSTDRTREVAALFGATIVDGGLPGPGRNRGAETAQGDILFFFDADVQLSHKDFLHDCLVEMERRSLDVATCQVRALEGKLTDDVLHEIYNLYAIATERMIPHAPGFCLFARAQAHCAIGGFDERVVFAEDHDYAQRAGKAGFSYGIIREQRIGVSVRRLEKEGRLKLAVKYIYGELHMRLKGPFFDDLPFDYEFANFDGNADKTKNKQPPAPVV